MSFWQSHHDAFFVHVAFLNTRHSPQLWPVAGSTGFFFCRMFYRYVSQNRLFSQRTGSTTSHSPYSWPVAGILRVSVLPHVLQVRVSSPSFSHVAFCCDCPFTHIVLFPRLWQGSHGFLLYHKLHMYGIPHLSLWLFASFVTVSLHTDVRQPGLLLSLSRHIQYMYRSFTPSSVHVASFLAIIPMNGFPVSESLLSQLLYSRHYWYTFLS